MIDIKVAALTGIVGLAAVDSGIPPASVHNTLFTTSTEYSSRDDCIKNIRTIERQRPKLKGKLSCVYD